MQIKYNLSAGIFKIDDIDKKIITLIQGNPKMTHSNIAKIVKMSQPTVGIRIKKLRDFGILKIQHGINFKYADIYLVTVYLKAKNPNSIFKMAKYCPFMLNAFKLSGEYNVSLLIASTDIKRLYNVVNAHFRANSEIQKISMELITDIARDFILPFDFDSEALTQSLESGCSARCEYCKNLAIL